MTNSFDENFWDNRYATGNTGWDIGYVSTPLKEYFDQLEDRGIHVLIPGGGNAYEAQYLFEHGFRNVDVVDISSKPLREFAGRNPEFPSEQLIHADFFDLQSSYDLIVEQTFLCALDPGLRTAYARKMNELLKPGGKLVGVLFDFPLTEKGPPFGGSHAEFNDLFSNDFEILVLERSYNSIPERQGAELFMILKKQGHH